MTANMKTEYDEGSEEGEENGGDGKGGGGGLKKKKTLGGVAGFLLLFVICGEFLFGLEHNLKIDNSTNF